MKKKIAYKLIIRQLFPKYTSTRSVLRIRTSLINTVVGSILLTVPINAYSLKPSVLSKVVIFRPLGMSQPDILTVEYLDLEQI